MTLDTFLAPPLVTLRLHDADHRAVLRMPSIGETHVFVANPSLHRSPAAHEQADYLQVLDVIDAFDGQPMTMELAREITRDEAARAAVMRARADWVAAWSDGGVALALCPACRRGEVELRNAVLAPMLGVARRPVADADGRLMPFFLSFSEAGPRPADAAACARLRFRLPSGAAAAPRNHPVEGVVTPIDPIEEARAWQRHAPIGIDPAEDQDDWTFESAGFRAVLRIACALDVFGAHRRPDITPADVEPLALGDFSFLDELYFLAFLAPATNCPPVTCPACGAGFLPLR